MKVPFRKILFPHCPGPRMTRNSFSLTSRDISSTTRSYVFFVMKALDRFETFSLYLFSMDLASFLLQ